ncbi:hypothetical protein CBM2592_A10021 [Cupriavidus taiwanensis]|nr:hypothetical protein CBM2592_A10021 [Cupriavidus taiwanensis]SOZ60927.1 hypothetical protein CBM2617_A350023 [Cupriavidus taiwanensis]SOZ81107.1 hypothetical protein CBM2618_A310023 [Cupriavidus taiwanensis]SOZ81941.1 hypothetical protein CBM2622_A290022 [Cupriavidus taiwanensis]SOZ90571.1 hypothetical protein CBM2621_A300022 [Cupriavidus taiwanensis]
MPRRLRQPKSPGARHLPFTPLFLPLAGPDVTPSICRQPRAGAALRKRPGNNLFPVRLVRHGIMWPAAS